MINRASLLKNATMCMEKIAEFNKATNIENYVCVRGLEYHKVDGS